MTLIPAQIVLRLACVLATAAMCLLSAPAHAQSIDLLFPPDSPTTSEAVDHAAWDTLLKRYVKAGSDGINRIDYAIFKARDIEPLRAYLARIAAVDPARLGRAEQFALLVNLYNAKTIEIVLSHYPVMSIKDISLGGSLAALVGGGPWSAKVVTIKGVVLSLDDIEHKILRAQFKDVRVHYAVNCASSGCPNLRPEAYTAGKLDAQLDAAARAYVNHPRGVRLTPDGLVVSSIYNWFKEDFGGTDAGVLAHLRRFAEPGLRDRLKTAGSINGYDYDWSLNDVVRGR